MAQVSVTIGERVYRLACGEGEEERIKALARIVDSKTAEIRAAFGEIGDQRIAVMVALTFADDLGEITRQRDDSLTQLAAAHAQITQANADSDADARALAETLNDAAQRVEQIVDGMNRAASH